jgi:hypothetical protein
VSVHENLLIFIEKYKMQEWFSQKLLQSSMSEIDFLPVPVLFFITGKDFLKISAPLNLIASFEKSY